MHDISDISGQELPSGKRLLLSTLIALVVAVVILVTAILPAEYGIDPTGLGQRMGLTALHQEDKPDAINTTSTTSTISTAEQNQDTDSANNANIPLTHEVVKKHTEKWRSDNLKLTLPAKRGLEVKARINQGEHLLFQWTANGGTVSFDMHGNVLNAAEDDFTSFWLGKGETQASGSFTAPFSGLHGWYWENEGDQPVTITLELEGYYQDLVTH